MATETSWRDDPVPGPTDPAYREPVEIGKGVTAALGAALVFGAATPFAKRFGAGVDHPGRADDGDG